MSETIHLETIFSEPQKTGDQRLALFALLNLGIFESLTCGLISAADAMRFFFHAENCLFVRQHLRDRIADEIMSRGVQLTDLFDALPADEAQREFRRELTTMRSLCLLLLEERRLAV